jgi:hypothetical protein
MAQISGVGVAAAAGGALLLYSGIKGKGFSSAVRSLLAGQSPSAALGANSISGTTVADVTGTTAASGGSGDVSAVTPSSASETAWIVALLTSLGAPSTQANINSISSWINHEGPYGTQGQNNPLNTTIRSAGFTGTFDGTPVSDFATATEGIAATVQTLLGGNYSSIVSALRSGNGLCGQSFAALGTWSGGGYTRVC